MTRVAVQYGGEEYVVRDPKEEVLGRITSASGGDILEFRMGERKTLHLRVSDGVPLAVVITESSSEPLSPPSPMIVTRDPGDDLGPLPRF